jgi:hypothetical protein
MTPVSIRILALAAVASLPLVAQQPPSPSAQSPTGSSPQTAPQQQTNPESGASQTSNPEAGPVPPAGNSSAVSSPQLRPVTGELENKLDTKDAKAGDAVVVKTTQKATTATGMEIPIGSEIKGHIVDVAPKGQDGQNSRVTIQLDQAQLKSGQNLPIRSVIQSVAPAGTTTQADAAGGTSSPAPSGGGDAAGAGVTGSQPAGNSSSPPAASGQAPGANPSQAAQAGAAQAPGTVVATKGNLAIKTTSIPGVLLIGDVNGRPFSNASGALLGANQDVHLEGGTVMVVAIMTAPSTMGAK